MTIVIGPRLNNPVNAFIMIYNFLCKCEVREKEKQRCKVQQNDNEATTVVCVIL